GFAKVRGTVVNTPPAQRAPARHHPARVRPAPAPAGPPQVQPIQCSGGVPTLPAPRPNAKAVYVGWINPCLWPQANQHCRQLGLKNAVLLQTGYEYVGNKAYPQILVGCETA